ARGRVHGPHHRARPGLGRPQPRPGRRAAARPRPVRRGVRGDARRVHPRADEAEAPNGGRVVTATASAPTATDELLAHDRWSRDKMLPYQRDRLRDVIAHAVTSSPYYRETLGRDALAGDIHLDELPILTKQTLMEQFDRVVADPRLRLAALEAHATGG